MKRGVNSLRDSEIAAAVAAYMFNRAKSHPVAGRLWEGSLGSALGHLFDGRLDEKRATTVRSFLRLNRFSSFWENGVFKGWKVPAENPLSNWKSELPRARTKVNPKDLISPLPVADVKVSCLYCGETFNTNVEFETHKKGKVKCVVAEAKCRFCGKEFMSSKSYTAHVRTHTQEIEALIVQAIEEEGGSLTRRSIEETLNLGFHLDAALNRLADSGVVTYKRSFGGGGRWFLKNAVKSTNEVKSTPSEPIEQAEYEPAARILENIERLALEDLKKRHEAEYQNLVLGIIDKLTTTTSVVSQ